MLTLSQEYRKMIGRYDDGDDDGSLFLILENNEKATLNINMPSSKN